MCRGFRLHQALKPEPFHPEPERGPGADPGESVNAPTDEQVLVHCPDLVGPPADEIRISRNVMGDPNDVETFPKRVPAGATSNLAAPKWPMNWLNPCILPSGSCRRIFFWERTRMGGVGRVISETAHSPTIDCGSRTNPARNFSCTSLTASTSSRCPTASLRNGDPPAERLPAPRGTTLQNPEGRDVGRQALLARRNRCATLSGAHQRRDRYPRCPS